MKMRNHVNRIMAVVAMTLLLGSLSSCQKGVKTAKEQTQNFSIIEASPTYSTDEVQYDVQMFFTMPVTTEDALKVFDKSFVDRYQVTPSYLGGNKYNFNLSNIKRENQDASIEMVLDGKPLNSSTKISKVLPVYSKGSFKVVDFKVDKSDNTATIIFSQPIKQHNIEGFVTLEPEMSYRTEIVENKIVLYLDKSNYYNYEMEEVTLTVGSGIKDVNGNSLQEEASFTFDLTDLAPKVKWTEGGVIVPEVGEAVVYFDAICLKSVVLRIVRVFDDNMLSYYQDNSLEDTYDIRKAGRLVKKVNVALDNATPSQWKTYPIVLSDYVDVKAGEMYQLILDFGPADYAFATEESKQLTLEDDALEANYWDGDAYDYKRSNYDGDWDDPLTATYYNYVQVKKNVIVTNLAVTAKMGDNESLDVFVFTIDQAQPASGAEVTAYNFQCQQVSSAKTDAKGHAHLTCSNRPAFVVAKDGKNGVSIIKTNKGESLSYSKFDVGGESVEKGVAAFAYSNRGVWRPGDELQLNLMVSDLDAKLPSDYPVVMEVYDASDRLYARQSNNSPVGGIYTYNVATSPNDETGLWRAAFKVGNSVINKYLRVETVKPNRLEIKFNTPEVISLSKPGYANLNAKWLTGLTASGLKATIDAKVRQGQTTFKNFPTYTFVNDSEEFYPEEATVFSGPLDGQGNAPVGFDALSNLSSDQMLKAVFTTKVFEQGGDFSVSSSTAMLSPYERYVGVELPATESKYGSYYFTNRNWKFPIAVVKENGELAKSTISLDYQFYKLDGYWWWSSEDAYSLQKYVSGSYKNPETNGRLTCNNGKTELTLNVPDKKWGLYLLVINDIQGGNTFAKVLNFDWSDATIHASGNGDGPMQLAMSSTKDSYKLGENIIVTFPSNDKAKALVTVEANDRVLQTMVLDKLGTEGKVEIKVTEEMVPNVYVYVSLIQPRNADNDMPLRMYGVIPVKIEDSQLQLKPVLSVPETSNTNKKIQVTVEEQNAKAMTYTLAVVDEGILGLTNFGTPDPYGYFNAKQSLKVRTWDNYKYVIDGFTGELGTVFAIGGDGMINQEVTLDKRFKAFAVTYGPFELKAKSKNTHEFEVPQCSGALRFMVVAKGNGKSFGSAEKQMKVVDPITLYPAAPRVAAPGDELWLKVQVMAPTMKGQTLQVEVKNQNLTPVNNLPTSVKIDNYGEGMIAMKVKVPETVGNATMDVKVSGGGFEARSTTAMPIRMPYSEKRKTYTVEVEPNATRSFDFEVKGMDGTQEGNVTVASLIPVDMYSRLNYLTTYPYGCLEQVVSAAFPQLYINYFIQQTEAAQEDTRDAIQEGIVSLKSYLRSDFSLTNWRGGNYVNYWTEIYALHFLVEAKNQGFDVPSYMLEGMLKYQNSLADEWRKDPAYKQGETIQAYRLFVLALGGNPNMKALNRFKEINMDYSLTRVLAAAAYAQVGKPNMVNQLWKDINPEEPMSDYYTSFGSTSRDLAFLTYSEMLCSRDEMLIQTHVNDLCNILNSDRWLDTQSTAFVLFTLGKYAEKMGTTNSPISATVKLNGEAHTLSTNMGSTGFAITPKIGSNKLEITNNCDQKLTAKAYTKSAVAEYEKTENGNFIKMKVNYFDKKGAPINPESLTMGTDFNVEITVENPSEYQVTELALSYYLASGWEIINERVNGEEGNRGAKHLDIRDDRAYFFFDLTPRSKKTFKLKLNATFEGSYMLPPVRCEDMYNNAIYYVVPARPVVVH